MQGIGWRSWRPRPESPCQLPGVERALTGGAVHLEAAALKRVVGDHQVRLHRAYHVGDGLDFVLGDQDVVVLEAEVAHVIKAKNVAGATHLLQLLLNRLRNLLLHVKLGAGSASLFAQFPVVGANAGCQNRRRPCQSCRQDGRRPAISVSVCLPSLTLYLSETLILRKDLVVRRREKCKISAKVGHGRNRIAPQKPLDLTRAVA